MPQAEIIKTPSASAPVGLDADAGEAKINLIGLGRAAFADVLATLGEKPFRTKQLWHWVYHRGVTDFEAMTTIGKALRARLGAAYSLARPETVSAELSRDGTRKWLLRFADGNEVETVFIPDDDRGTLCVSSQVGCTLNCRFCHTGTQRLVRNLGPAEIVAQVVHARDAIGDWAAPPGERQITNIVMMGMGEPLYNFDNVATALGVVMDNEGIAISKRRITLSTAGVVPMMARCGEELGVNLAVSLHATNDAVRDEIVPINRKYPLAKLLEACRAYPGVHNARRITFEYIMLKGINDTDADARALIDLLRGIPAKVNLIPFNPWPGAPYACSPPRRIRRFSDLVFAAGIAAPIRAPRGRDIMAACGQLKSASEKLTAAQRRLAMESA